MFKGMLLSVLLATIATIVQYLPFPPFTLTGGTHPIEAILVAIILGIIVANTLPLSNKLMQGIDFSANTFLSVAIVLLGAGLNIGDILHLSLYTVFVLVVSISLVFILTFLFGRMLGMAKNPSILVAMGTAICGSSAILVAARTIKASQHDVAMSITTINLLGLIAIFVFPLLGHFFRLTENSFGIWAGISIQAVPQVVAAGFSYGHFAGKVATVVKLVRVLFLAPFIVIVKWMAVRKDNQKASKRSTSVSWQYYVPPFILFFALMILFRSLGVIQNFHLFGQAVPLLVILSKTASFLMSTALAAIGLKTDIKKCLTGGVKTLALGLVAAIILALISGLLLTQI